MTAYEMRFSDWSSDVCSSDLDALADFIRAMELEGVKALEPIAARIASGELIRFRCDGDGHGRQNGWAILYLDQRPAGAFGNYRLGISRKWLVDRYLSLTPAERPALQRELATANHRLAVAWSRSYVRTCTLLTSLHLFP